MQAIAGSRRTRLQQRAAGGRELTWNERTILSAFTQIRLKLRTLKSSHVGCFEERHPNNNKNNNKMNSDMGSGPDPKTRLCFIGWSVIQRETVLKLTFVVETAESQTARRSVSGLLGPTTQQVVFPAMSADISATPLGARHVSLSSSRRMLRSLIVLQKQNQRRV